jgi:hypothetical protein
MRKVFDFLLGKYYVVPEKNQDNPSARCLLPRATTGVSCLYNLLIDFLFTLIALIFNGQPFVSDLRIFDVDILCVVSFIVFIFNDRCVKN